ncbi:MAG: exodeoxyribonuclease VII small subunit [Candidatus Omnitrophica bacterium]|nr:exodeoxyribonuclease VII small subunit [Candidatus Omnitrophota bacterium]
MAEVSFEKALEKLEKIVGELETGNVSLEDALSRYEEGIKLSRLCQEKLAQAEKKIEVLSKSVKGELVRKPFEESDESEADEAPRVRKSRKPGVSDSEPEGDMF